MKYFLFSVISLSFLFSQSSWVIELGFKGVIPEVFNETYTASDDEKTITVNQSALPQRDFAPFPSIAQGLVLNVLEAHNKFDIGFGYEFHFDYHTIFYTNNSGQNKTFTAKLQNNLLYGMARLNLKHDRKHSIFVGLKLGLILSVQGFADDLGLLNSLAVDEGISFDPITMDSVSPGLYGALQFGFKLYLFRELKLKVFPGIKVIAELGGATSTFKTGRQSLSDDKSSVVAVNNDVLYNWNYSNVGIRFLFFLELSKKKSLIFKNKKKIEYEQY